MVTFTAGSFAITLAYPGLSPYKSLIRTLGSSRSLSSNGSSLPSVYACGLQRGLFGRMCCTANIGDS